jgi:chromosome segregation ATPase
MTQAHSIPSDTNKTYRSPRRILVRFFEKSRNQWKVKCLEAKAALRRIKSRAKWLEQSRDHWKARAQTLAHRVQELEAQTATQQHDIEALKKSRARQSRPRTP